MKPQLVLLAGPNGAGKTTFYEAHLRDKGLPFLNADISAAMLGLDAYEAARTLDALRKWYIDGGLSFISETVFSDEQGAKLGMLREALAAGFEVHLIYIGVDSPELAQARVLHRVENKGHPVPPDKIAARYPRSLANLAEAIRFVPSVEILDNSDPTNPHRQIAVFRGGVLKTKSAGPVPAWAKPLLKINAKS